MTKIQWPDEVWNCVVGGLTMMTKKGPRWTGDVRFVPEKLSDPLRWRKPRMVFVNSMSDLFHEDLTDDAILQVINVIRQCEHHTFQVITKRPERMRSFMSRLCFDSSGDGRMYLEDRGLNRQGMPISFAPVMHQMWLGVSVEDQKTADERIPLLLDTPAAVRWVSAEPTLSPLNLGVWLDAPALSWVVCGGESGPGARVCHVDWLRNVIRQCRNASVPVFCKQIGSNVDWGPRGWNDLRHSKGGDIDEWPWDLRVREFPPSVCV